MNTNPHDDQTTCLCVNDIRSLGLFSPAYLVHSHHVHISVFLNLITCLEAIYSLFNLANFCLFSFRNYLISSTYTYMLSITHWVEYVYECYIPRLSIISIHIHDIFPRVFTLLSYFLPGNEILSFLLLITPYSHYTHLLFFVSWVLLFFFLNISYHCIQWVFYVQ